MHMLPAGTSFGRIQQTVLMDLHQNPRKPEHIEEQLHSLEDQYAEALGNDADIYTLSAIWRKIKDLKRELEDDNPGIR